MNIKLEMTGNHKIEVFGMYNDRTRRIYEFNIFINDRKYNSYININIYSKEQELSIWSFKDTINEEGQEVKISEKTAQLINILIQDEIDNYNNKIEEI